MPLSSLINTARCNHAVQKQIVYRNPEPRFIDADAVAEEKKKEQEEQHTNGDWRECPYLKELNSDYYCNFFMAKCACEKCNGRLPLAGEKKRR